MANKNEKSPASLNAKVRALLLQYVGAIDDNTYPDPVEMLQDLSDDVYKLLEQVQ